MCRRIPPSRKIRILADTTALINGILLFIKKKILKNRRIGFYQLERLVSVAT